MNRRMLLTSLPCGLLGATTKKVAARNRFIGTWALVSYESKDKLTNEIRYPYGRNPIGRLTYDIAGNMSAHLMRPDRRSFGGPPTRAAAEQIQAASAEDLRDVLTGFNAYFGSFDIDEPSRTVIHHVKGSLLPSWVGMELRRTYEFSEHNQLTLSVAMEHSFNRILWQRELPPTRV